MQVTCRLDGRTGGREDGRTGGRDGRTGDGSAKVAGEFFQFTEKFLAMPCRERRKDAWGHDLLVALPLRSADSYLLIRCPR